MQFMIGLKCKMKGMLRGLMILEVILIGVLGVFQQKHMALSCDSVIPIQISALITGIIAALLWLKSALIKLPETTIGLKELNDSLKLQSAWNAYAATLTALAVTLQGLLVYAQVCFAEQHLEVDIPSYYPVIISVAILVVGISVVAQKVRK